MLKARGNNLAFFYVKIMSNQNKYSYCDSYVRGFASSLLYIDPEVLEKKIDHRWTLKDYLIDQVKQALYNAYDAGGEEVRDNLRDLMGVAKKDHDHNNYLENHERCNCKCNYE